MTTAKLPDCRLKPVRVYQMQVGDVYGVREGGLVADVRGRVYVMLDAATLIPGAGLVTVERKEDGYYLDLSHVPGVRWSRDVPKNVRISRVRGVTGIGC